MPRPGAWESVQRAIIGDEETDRILRTRRREQLAHWTALALLVGSALFVLCALSFAGLAICNAVTG